MQPNKISDKYFVSPQIEATQIKDFAEAGFGKIICNRPNEEISRELHSNVMANAAESAGIAFDFLPLTLQRMNAEIIAKQRLLIEEADGPVLAYCESGTRCAVIWAFLQAGNMASDDILQATANAGYNLEGLHFMLD